LEITPVIVEQSNQNSLYQTQGISLEEAVAGKARTLLTPKSEVCWPFPDQPHGGVLFTTMDTTMAWAVLSIVEPGYGCSTIDLNIQYLAPASKGPYFCQAWITHRTGRMAFLRAEIKDSHQSLIATAQSVFRIIKRAII
jgi:uncharacterized protein (TIGR00369 family)